MFVTRVGLAISAAIFVASCSNQADIRTYSATETTKAAKPAVRFSRADTDYRPAHRVAARKERSKLDVERPIAGGL